MCPLPSGPGFGSCPLLFSSGDSAGVGGRQAHSGVSGLLVLGELEWETAVGE